MDARQVRFPGAKTGWIFRWAVYAPELQVGGHQKSTHTPQNEQQKIAPEDGWLEYDCFLFGFRYYSQVIYNSLKLTAKSP